MPAKWTAFFDRIYLVNLPERPDRLRRTSAALHSYNIDFELVRAVGGPEGRLGLLMTLQALWQKALSQGFERILVFEDDLAIVEDPTVVMEKVIEQLPKDFDMLYLGCNLAQTLTRRYSENLLPVTRALSTHAVAYSAAAMKKILSLPMQLPVDVWLASAIQAAGKSFCTYPMLVSQMPGYSDIERRHTDWSLVLERRFKEKTVNLNLLPCLHCA